METGQSDNYSFKNNVSQGVCNNTKALEIGHWELALRTRPWTQQHAFGLLMDSCKNAASKQTLPHNKPIHSTDVPQEWLEINKCINIFKKLFPAYVICAFCCKHESQCLCIKRNKKVRWGIEWWMPWQTMGGLQDRSGAVCHPSK